MDQNIFLCAVAIALAARVPDVIILKHESDFEDKETQTVKGSFP